MNEYGSKKHQNFEWLYKDAETDFLNEDYLECLKSLNKLIKYVEKVRK